MELEQNIAIDKLEHDIKHIATLLNDLDEQGNLELRRRIRPLAVELLYEVIGTPKTFQEVLNEMEEN